MANFSRNIDNKRFEWVKSSSYKQVLVYNLNLQVFGTKNLGLIHVRVGANYLRHDYSGLTFPRTDLANDELRGTYNSDDVTGKANHFTAAGGIGSNLWLTKNFGLNYKVIM